jgi:nucleoid-associated protein YgaU
MLSQSKVVWIGGAAASTVVAAGAVAGALLWTHPDFRWQSPAGTQASASAPEVKAASVPPTAPAVETANPAASAPGPAGQAAIEAETAPLKPAFDVVSVEPTGEAVIAGRAAPNAKVELRDAGKTVAEATADASGQFVFTPPALAPGDHSLSLTAGDSKAAPETSNVVAVSVPQPEAKAATAVALPAPAASPAPAPPALTMRTIAKPPASPGVRVAIQTVEADAAGGLIARGSAEPHATVRLYLNQAPVADARTQSDGRWSLTIRSGMTPGDYLIRADEVTGGSTVVASAGTPFAYPEAPAPAPASPSAPPSALTESLAAASLAAASAGGAPSPADPVIDSVQTKRVVSGHTLWALSQNYYRDPTRYPVIVEANKWEIHNPNLIYPGEVFVVPKFEPKP